MKLVGWKSNVNKRILDSTSINIGSNGYIEDTDSTGHKSRRLTSLTTPDTFQVVMDFDWGGSGSEFQFPIDKKGLTEYDRFVRWYKFEHKRGACPFWFPCITKHPIDNLRNDEFSQMCLYKITSALTPVKSGYSMRVTMTWEEVYSGVVTVEKTTPVLNSIIAHNGFVEIYFTSEPESEPILSNFIISITNITTGVSELYAPKNIKGSPEKYTLYFNKVTNSGNYEVSITYLDVTKSDVFIV